MKCWKQVYPADMHNKGLTQTQVKVFYFSYKKQASQFHSENN